MNKLVLFGLIGIFLIAGVFGFMRVNANTTNTQTASDSVILRITIPCEGHVSFMKSELNKIQGITSSEYLGSYQFKVFYDSSKINPEQILQSDIFKQYPAKIV